MIEWISVDDRLPKKHQRVLVGRAGSKGVFGLIFYNEDFCSGEYWRDSSYNIFASPTHWMPLPEPPACEGSK